MIAHALALYIRLASGFLMVRCLNVRGVFSFSCVFYLRFQLLLCAFCKDQTATENPATHRKLQDTKPRYPKARIQIYNAQYACNTCRFACTCAGS